MMKMKIPAPFLIFLLLNMTGGLYSQVSTVYWPNGNPREKGMLIDSIRTGPWMTWHENGNIADSGAYIPGSIDNLRVELGSNEVKDIDTSRLKIKMMPARFSVKNGKWICNYKNGRRMEEGEYYPLEVICIESVMDPSNNGILYSIPQPEPMKTGRWKYYNENGNLEQEQEFNNGHAAGIQVNYHENGMRASEGWYYYRGYGKTGRWLEWDQDGKLVKVTIYNSDGSAKDVTDGSLK